jgi:hypothetical protein
MIEGCWLRGIDRFRKSENAVNFRGNCRNSGKVEHRAEGEFDLERTLDFCKKLSA